MAKRMNHTFCRYISDMWPKQKRFWSKIKKEDEYKKR